MTRKILAALMACLILFLDAGAQHRGHKHHHSKKKKKGHHAARTYTMPEPVVKSAYTVEGLDPEIILPDSLGGSKAKGFVVIKLTADDNAQIEKTAVTRLSLRDKNSGNTIVNYNILKDGNTDIIERYNTFFDNYCRTKLMLEKQGPVQSTNDLYIKVNIE